MAQKILDLIPEALRGKLIEEVKEIINEEQQEKDELEKDEVSPSFTDYLARKKEDTKRKNQNNPPIKR